MSDTATIEFNGITKQFGSVTAVNSLSFAVKPGKVTGLLGPNGSGKTTSLRMLLGLITPSAGHATIGGQPYQHIPDAAKHVGSVLETNNFHPAHTARHHLKIHAAASGIDTNRIGDVLVQVGMDHAADRKIGGFSLGMRQRLGLATALLGDPQVLIMDEPINGLDPQGISWMRQLLKFLASEGRTVLISSHLLAEVEQTVEELVIINQGNLVFQGSMDSLSTGQSVLIDSIDRAQLSHALTGAGYTAIDTPSGLSIENSTPAELGQFALEHNIALTLLRKNDHGLEERFFSLIGGTK